MTLRYIPNHQSELLKAPDPLAELTLSLTTLTTSFPPRSNYPPHFLQGLWSGPTSIAYLFLHLSVSHPNLQISSHDPKYWCEAYLSGSYYSTPAVSPDRCGIANDTLAYYAVSAALTQDKRSITSLENFAIQISQAPGGSDEWLYGRAGFLYLLRLVRHWVPSLADRMNICIVRMSQAILSHGPPWPWHGKEYLGAVHGQMGILTQLILSDHRIARDPKVSEVLNSLLDSQDQQTGNFPSSVASSHSHLVQVCHGAPGFAVSLPVLYPFFPAETQTRIDAAVEKAQDCIWERGLLTKEPCLCHGATGNALALEEGVRREHFLAYTAIVTRKKGIEEGRFIEGSDPWGLWMGEAGRAWGWMYAEKGGLGKLIGYSDV
ncbi:MAG: hypothetical protein LQ342_005367 [Letrouitia transgressa]|nr:MAG: hypothetical protein LQ342_005367 [Letrouitia transgressa]